jgi:hypothetical protein
MVADPPATDPTVAKPTVNDPAATVAISAISAIINGRLPARPSVASSHVRPAHTAAAAAPAAAHHAASADGDAAAAAAGRGVDCITRFSDHDGWADGIPACITLFSGQISGCELRRADGIPGVPPIACSRPIVWTGDVAGGTGGRGDAAAAPAATAAAATAAAAAAAAATATTATTVTTATTLSAAAAICFAAARVPN